MAFVLGNHNNGNNNSEGGNFSNSNYVFKDEVKSDWYLYRAADKSVVRPYPVYDDQGVPCPVTGNIDPENQFSVFSEAFAVVPLVVFAGLDGKLQFIDYCPDADSYAHVGEVLTRSPYSFMIAKLREMLPEKDKATTKSGLPTPPRLAQAQKNIHFAATSLLFRGAMVRSKGKVSASKHAVGGIMFKSVFYVSVKSAIDSLIAELQKPKDPRYPWSVDNSAASGLFELDGLTIQFDKSGAANSDPYRVSFGYEPGYVSAASQFFNIPADPAAYHAAVRNLYGPNQTLSDIFRLLTVAEMVSILKEKYPISWVYYGLKDSPYATLLTADDREAALSDPELAPWFGLSAAPHSGAQTYPTASHPTYQQAYPGYSNGPATAMPTTPAYPGTTPDFMPSNPGYQSGVPMGSPQPAAPAPSAAQSKADFYRAKYGAGSASADTDGIKY